MKRVCLPIALAAALLSPRLALPCSVGCSEHVIAPAEDAIVPSNLPAVVVALRDGYPLETQHLPTWVDEAGVAVPYGQEVVGRWRLLKPLSGLVPGMRYTVTVLLPNDCQSGKQTRHFTAGPVETLPDKPPLAGLESVSVKDFLTSRSGSCNARVPAAVAQLNLTELTLGGFHSTAALEAFVDGSRWGLSLPGEADDPQHVMPAPFNDWKSPLEIFSVCPSDDNWLEAGLAAGVHKVTLRVVIPGGLPGPLSAPIEVDLSCPAEPPEESPEANVPDDVPIDSADGSLLQDADLPAADGSGIDDVDAAPAEALVDDAGVDGEALAAEPESEPTASDSVGSCSAQAKSRPMSVLVLAVVAMAVAYRWRRRPSDP